MPSAEAELYAIVRGSTEALGMKSLMKDAGMKDYKADLHADASAALAVVERKGAGKLRHIHTNVLWVQQQIVREHIKYHKVPGKSNPSDLLTKNVDKETMTRHIHRIAGDHMKGRAQAAANSH